MALAWTIWACLIFIFIAIMILGYMFEIDWLMYLGAVGLILEFAALFVLAIIGSYLNGEITNGNT